MPHPIYNKNGEANTSPKSSSAAHYLSRKSVQDAMAIVRARTEARAAIDSSSTAVSEQALASASALVRQRRRERVRSTNNNSAAESAKEQWQQRNHRRRPLSPKQELEQQQPLQPAALSVIPSTTNDSSSKNHSTPTSAVAPTPRVANTTGNKSKRQRNRIRSKGGGVVVDKQAKAQAAKHPSTHSQRKGGDSSNPATTSRGGGGGSSSGYDASQSSAWTVNNNNNDNNNNKNRSRRLVVQGIPVHPDNTFTNGPVVPAMSVTGNSTASSGFVEQKTSAVAELTKNDARRLRDDYPVASIVENNNIAPSFLQDQSDNESELAQCSSWKTLRTTDINPVAMEAIREYIDVVVSNRQKDKQEQSSEEDQLKHLQTLLMSSETFGMKDDDVSPDDLATINDCVEDYIESSILAQKKEAESVFQSAGTSVVDRQEPSEVMSLESFLPANAHPELVRAIGAYIDAVAAAQNKGKNVKPKAENRTAECQNKEQEEESDSSCESFSQVNNSKLATSEVKYSLGTDIVEEQTRQTQPDRNQASIDSVRLGSSSSEYAAQNIDPKIEAEIGDYIDKLPESVGQVNGGSSTPSTAKVAERQNCSKASTSTSSSVNLRQSNVVGVLTVKHSEDEADCLVELVSTASSVEAVEIGKPCCEYREVAANENLPRNVAARLSENEVELIRRNSTLTGKGDPTDKHSKSIEAHTSASSNSLSGKAYEQELVTNTPSTKVTTLTLSRPNSRKCKGGVQSSEEKKDDESSDTAEDDIVVRKRDADGIYTGHDEQALDRGVRKLFPLLAGSEDSSDGELRAFIQLVRFSFPFIEDKEPTAFEVSRILSTAKTTGVSLSIVDRFLDLCQSTLQERTKRPQSAETIDNSQTLTEDERIVLLFSDLLVHMEKHGARIVADKGDAMDFREEFQRSGEDAFEVDLHCGFVKKEDAPKGSDEPWWEVVARLNGSRTDDIPYIHSPFNDGTKNLDCTSNEITGNDMEDGTCRRQTETPGVKKDIDRFWKEQEEARRRSRIPSRKSKTVKRGKIPRRNTSTSIADMKRPTRSFSSNAASFSSDNTEKSWIKKRDIAMWSINQPWDSSKSWLSRKETVEGASYPEPISAVTAAADLLENGFASRDFPFSGVWQRPYAQRTQNHGGFYDVDVYSLYDTSAARNRRHPLDASPWESRVVKQRFLYEQSISFCRNWFGCLVTAKGNKKFHEPVCRPKSMEMPMKAEEWTEEWYKQPSCIVNMVSFGGDGGVNAIANHGIQDDDSFDDESWEETPECGKLKNVKLRIGERLSRVTPDLTSSLRRSRWRKKHFPQNTFPYK